MLANKKSFFRVWRYDLSIQSKTYWLSIIFMIYSLIFLWNFSLQPFIGDSSKYFYPILFSTIPIIHAISTQQILLKQKNSGHLDFLLSIGVSFYEICLISLLNHILWFVFPLIFILMIFNDLFLSWFFILGLFLFLFNAALLVNFFQCLMLTSSSNPIMSAIIIMPLSIPIFVLFFIHMFQTEMWLFITSFTILHFSIHFLLSPYLIKQHMQP